MNDTFERIEGCTVIYLLVEGILMAEVGKVPNGICLHPAKSCIDCLLNINDRFEL